MIDARVDPCVILKVSDGSGGFSYEVFTGVPLVTSALIVLNAVPEEKTALEQLASALRRTLVSLAPQARQEPQPVVGSLGLSASAPVIQVLLCSRSGDAPEEGTVEGEGSSVRLLPVFPFGANLSSLAETHPELAKINAAFWSSSAAEVVPTVLAAAGITSEDFRIFISYRRLDSAPLAIQLFHALTEAGFDVFLDRFSIEPAVDFQVRLTQELADKSMILLLESANLAASSWTEIEIAFAKKHELGLVSILMPDGVARPDVDSGARIDPPPEDWAPAQDGPGHELRGDALTRVVSRVKEEHGRTIVRRRQRIRDSMLGALRLRNVNARVREDGLVQADTGHRSYSIWLTPRPPDLADFHFTHARLHPDAGSGVSKGIVVGPTAFLEVLRRARTSWLAERCAFACFDEDRITDIATEIAEGGL